MAAATPDPDAGPSGSALWRPFLARAVIAAVFGLVTIFWREPSTLVMSVAGGLYLLLTGVVYLWLHRVRQWRHSSLLADIGGGLLLGAGIASLVFVDDRSYAIAGAVALAVAGVAELVRGLTLRGHAAARDLLVLGVVGIGTGVILPFVEPLGAHALLGVTGGGALLSAVVLGIAALSYRHDSALSAPDASGAQGESEPVN
ncbi:hypothetical protein FJV46_06285 [Arthrobacter agilis]|uniref:DUF308 domain-containing protein n=1 Tax=Arthrobacter agilis TaxID=37921 RepID=UPI000B35D739|nr:DUF308 domain-containing protein [Arthrobacter agilis]OUM42201.1 hypothetical protein B8W74_08790 [Arthrobacter agilis]PPB45543.1 hypothetical protein CI784_10780 [Arthrobacter agilis]TPV26481.1 hypothetical protein FJV46_06285 [Arthrobacter agilis]VDR33615.1 Uncharacterized conserved protein [Arthrobacter agilis]